MALKEMENNTKGNVIKRNGPTTSSTCEQTEHSTTCLSPCLVKTIALETKYQKREKLSAQPKLLMRGS